MSADLSHKRLKTASGNTGIVGNCLDNLLALG